MLQEPFIYGDYKIYTIYLQRKAFLGQEGDFFEDDGSDFPVSDNSVLCSSQSLITFNAIK